MLIRPALPSDSAGIWKVLEPVIRAGETWALARDMSESEARAYWMADDREAFVAEEEGKILGTYFLRANHAGGGSHVANSGYMTAADATGRGVGRALCLDSLERPASAGSARCSSTSWSAPTSARSGCGTASGSRRSAACRERSPIHGLATSTCW